ncbi:MAG TPA: hypothetical protein VGP41_16475 [Candidatus Lustribacter sp.]|nr:hypothetical protein [Candidatus Lustribacter sp.]
MEQQSKDAAAKGLAFANGLRKSITVAGRRWSQWPGGANNLAAVIAIIDRIQQRLQASATSEEESEAAVAAAISDLRALLEWTTYQSASIATARAVLVARKTRAFAERLNLIDDPATTLSGLVDSEESLMENVGLKNDYMNTLAAKHPHLELPPPLVNMESLAPKIERKAGRLDLIQLLKKSAKKK